MSWPQVSFVAEDHKGRIVGYVLAKMCVNTITRLIVTGTRMYQKNQTDTLRPCPSFAVTDALGWLKSL